LPWRAIQSSKSTILGVDSKLKKSRKSIAAGHVETITSFQHYVKHIQNMISCIQSNLRFHLCKLQWHAAAYSTSTGGPTIIRNNCLKTTWCLTAFGSERSSVSNFESTFRNNEGRRFSRLRDYTT
jgi:CRISPR/Cas system CMR-associated protein Cmr3 (group 5 of RAMP superfamily)